jgi:phospholipase/carboxylesterase
MNPPELSGFEHVFVPAREASGRLVIVLHGLGDSLEGFLFLPQVLALPGVNYLLLNAPLDYYGGYAWYDLEDPESGVLASRALLQEMVTELLAQGWESQNLLFFGFSQGCLMSLDFGLRFEQPLAGIVGISGYTIFLDRLAGEMHPQACKQHWLVTHGDEDELLPLARTRSQMERLKELGVPIEWHEFHKGHTLDPERELPLIQNWIAARFGLVGESNRPRS